VGSIGAMLLCVACAADGSAGANTGFTQGEGGTDQQGDGQGGTKAGEGGASSGQGEGGAGGGGEGGAGPGVDGGGGGTAAVPCGTSFCRADQTCSGNVCQASACAGPSVPGDYATISAAITALANTGTDVTICLKAQTYPSSTFAIADSANHQKSFKLVGVSADATIIQGSVTLGTGFASASISNVTIDGGQSSYALQASSASTTFTLTASRLRGSSVTSLYNFGTITFDGVDVQPAQNNGYAIQISAPSGSSASHFVLKNSYLHDCAYGVYASSVQTVDVMNNTILNCQNGIYGGGSGTLNYWNNVIAKSMGNGVNIQSPVTVTHGNNALWGNMTNYAGLAVAGAGYVTSDCNLDTHSPPAPGAGSPCKHAGDVTHAPAVDYYDVTRSSPVDIGAVETP
jgi:hypothetical protein